MSLKIRRVLLCTLAATFGLAAPALAQTTIDVANDSDLRAAILAVAPGDTIRFTQNITLASDLPSVNKAITIDGGGFTLSGNDQFRGLMIAAFETEVNNPVAINVAVQDLTITDTKAQGGAGGQGGDGGGGGGAG